MDLKNPTRTEALLANIAGHTDVPVPDMKNATRSERLLKEILDNGGGGGGDVTKEYVDSAIADAVADIDDDISALSNTVADKVDKVSGKGLSTNDYTDADKALVQDSPITITATTSPISTANGKPRKLTVYGKSEVVDGAIKSAGEGWATVDLGTLNWSRSGAGTFLVDITNMKPATTIEQRIQGLYCAKYQPSPIGRGWDNLENKHMQKVSQRFGVKDLTYTDTVSFKTAMSGVLLCYQLADPSQGNTIAIKTDNGTGINGTMATFSTGTPLYGVSADIRDFMEWDGSEGTVTKKCGAVDLGTLNDWSLQSAFSIFSAPISNIYRPTSQADRNHLLCSKYASYAGTIDDQMVDKTVSIANGNVYIKDEDYTTVTDFIASLGDAELVYELATPTTMPLTATENDSLSTLKTYSPQTTITINDSPDFKIEAYANTANGQAISDMQPTRSPLLTLTASGWTNNAQTVTFAHDIGKRNSIDVEPANIKAWTAAGILATAETATSITFECDTVPASDLSFRVTSMEVR